MWSPTRSTQTSTGGPPKPRLARVAAALAASVALLVSATARGDTYNGREIQNIARQSIDVMRAHHHALTAQMRADEVSPYTAAVTYKHMSATLQFPDGTESEGGLTRINAGAWMGGGRPRSGAAAFAGFQGDYVVVDGRVPEHTELGDGLVAAGTAFHGFQASLGLRFSWSRNFTEGGDLPTSSNPFIDRPGTPPAYRSPASFDPVSRIGLSGFVVSTQHAEGITLGGLVDDVLRRSSDGTFTRERVLVAARLIVEPERMFERLKLRGVGVPGVGLERIAPEVDYWGDRFRQVRDAGGDPAALAKLAPETKPLVEIPVQLSDIAGTGVRVKSVTDVSPKSQLRQVELGWSRTGQYVFGGTKLSGFRRADATTGSADAWVGVRAAKIFGFSVSYSRNSPDAATSLAVPNASVWGVQLVMGDPNLVAPVVPILQGPSSAKGETQ